MRDSTFRRLLRAPFRSRAAIARDVDDEIAFHLEMRTRELVEGGLSPAYAAEQARREFGDVARAREALRTIDVGHERAGRWARRVDELRQDVGYALRQLLRAPAFTTIAVLTLALGIASNTAIFSVVRRVLIDPLDFPVADRMVSVWMHDAKTGMSLGGFSEDFETIRAGMRGFEATAAYGDRHVTIGGEEPEFARAGEISAEYAPLVRARPLIGRLFDSADVVPGAAPVALLSEGLWRRRFGGRTEVLGRTIPLDEVPHTIVGVMRDGFDIPTPWAPPSTLFVPLPDRPTGKGAHRIASLVGLLRPGTTIETAEAELRGVIKPDSTRPWMADFVPRLRRPGELERGGLRDTLVLLPVAVGLVMLIACANVANLLVARGVARERELAVRRALGAGRGRIVRQMLTESVMLGALAVAPGLLLAQLGLRVIARIRPENLRRLDDVRIDGDVLAFTLALAIATGLLFGLFPALRAAAVRAQGMLGMGSSVIASGAGARRFRRVLVTGEVALAVVLLVGAALLVRAVQELQRVDPGFTPAGLLVVEPALPGARYEKPGAKRAFEESLLAEVRRVPGVRAATVAGGAPPNYGYMFGSFEIEGRAPGRGEQSTSFPANWVRPDYFRFMGIPLLRGAGFDAAGRDSALNPVVVSRSMARRYWGDETPIGKRIRLSAEGDWQTVVGEVGDVRAATSPASAAQQLYMPIWEGMDASLIVRADDPGALVPAIRRAVQRVDPQVAIREAVTVESLLARAVSRPRFVMTLLGAFAVVAAVLSAAGLYGVVAYAVQQRTREVGVRIALGARPSSVVRLIAREGVWLIVLGIVLGAAASGALAKLLSSFLYGVSPHDPVAFTVAPVLLAAVALLATVVPARRASRVDPVVALRSE